MRGGYMLIAYHLSSDKSRQTILHSCAHPNRLPSTASIIKMCPHLHVHKNIYSAQNLHYCDLSQSRTANLSTSWTVAELVQCVESFTPEWKVTGLIPGTGPIVRVLKVMLHETICNDDS